MKIQYVFGKSHDYNTMMSRQEKCQRAESSLKEVLAKINLTPPYSSVHTSFITNHCKNFFSNMLQAYVFFTF